MLTSPPLSSQTRELQFVVFDDAGGDDPLRAIIGVANVPLAGLAAGENALQTVQCKQSVDPTHTLQCAGEGTWLTWQQMLGPCFVALHVSCSGFALP